MDSITRRLVTLIRNVNSVLKSHKDETDNPHSVTTAQLSLDNVTNDAQLKRADNDWSGFTEESSPGTTDVLLLEKVSTGAKRKVQVTNLTGGGGGVATSTCTLALNSTYTEDSVPVSEVAGQQVFDGSKVGSGTVKFISIMTPTFATSGTAYCRLYDKGQPATPVPEVLIKEFSETTEGIRYNEQTLTVDSGGPGLNTIKDEPRLYEIKLFSSASAGDQIYLGSASFLVEV
jgi:hypothetical protein